MITDVDSGYLNIFDDMQEGAGCFLNSQIRNKNLNKFKMEITLDDKVFFYPCIKEVLLVIDTCQEYLYSLTRKL